MDYGGQPTIRIKDCPALLHGFGVGQREVPGPESTVRCGEERSERRQRRGVGLLIQLLSRRRLLERLAPFVGSPAPAFQLARDVRLTDLVGDGRYGDRNADDADEAALCVPYIDLPRVARTDEEVIRAGGRMGRAGERQDGDEY